MAKVSSGSFEADELEGLRAGVRIMALRALGDLEAADEAVQETLARAIAALRDGRLRDRAKLGAFVAGIARHVIADVFRARQRTLPIEALPLNVAVAKASDPLARIISDEERRRLEVALAQLSLRDRDILRMCFFEGLSPAEVAARLGESAERIRKRKSRALERLRRAFLDARQEGHE